MPDEVFNFRWSVDTAGYEIYKTQGVRSIINSGGPEARMRGRGGDMRWYNPLKDEPGLFRQFAATCVGRSDVLRFAGQFGPLWRQNGEEGVACTLVAAAEMRAVTKWIDSGDWRGAATIFNEHIKITFRPRISTPELTGRPTLQFTMGTLVEALWFQLALQLTGQTEFRVCKNCPTPFEVGTGAHTKRKMFCSDRCRVAWHRSE